MTKINQKSKFFVACLQIVNQLPFMFQFQIIDSLQFYNNLIFDNHISNIMTNLFSFIIDIHWFLTFTSNPLSFQFLVKSISIHCFQESKA